MYGFVATGGKFGSISVSISMSDVYLMSLELVDIMPFNSSSKSSCLSFVIFEISASCKIILPIDE